MRKVLSITISKTVRKIKGLDESGERVQLAQADDNQENHDSEIALVIGGQDNVEVLKSQSGPVPPDEPEAAIAR